MLAVHLFSFFFTKLKENPTKKVDRFLHAMCLHDDQLKDIAARLQAEMKKGLSSDSNVTASVKMLPTHVRSTPDGTEKGEFLALDLGGSEFKVLHVKVREDEGIKKGEVQIKEKIYPIPKELLSGKGTELFDYVSESLKEFLVEENLHQENKQPLAFTFAFPCEHEALDKAILLDWGKDFRARGLQGKDVVQTLKESIERIGGMDVEVITIVNDSVATMMTCGFDDQRCEVGLIVGNGTNACYMEEMRHIDLVEGDEGRMCVNTEWAAFGDDGALNDYITEFDRDIDAASNNQGKHIFEKMISGMYLGELVRLVVLKMAKVGLLFDGNVSSSLRTKGSVTSKHVAEMQQYKTGLDKTKEILTWLGLSPSDKDCVAVQHVSTIVSFRSSNLVAAGLSAILTRIKTNRKLEELKITVGVDGTVYKTHPHYSKRLQKVLRRLIPECQVRFYLSDSGSSKGAALVAAVAQRLDSQRQQVNKTLSPFKLSQEQLMQVKARMRAGLEAGLKAAGPSAIKMLPSFVCGKPDGSEHGKYLSLDLGGTNFRALLVDFRKGSNPNSRLDHKIYTMPPEILQGSGEELFDYIAQCISDFLDYMGMKNAKLPAGFTFSFPCEQTAINTGTLVAWTKGFKVSNCEGHDVVTMLNEAIERRNEFDLEIVSVVNDTVGTMMDCASDDPLCEIGLIAGTGTNVCYMEELRNIEKYKDHFEKAAGEEMTPGGQEDRTTGGDDGTEDEYFKLSPEMSKMCVNTEWGGLGDDGSLDDIITRYDTEVDQSSLNPGKQRFEKLTSGMYLGEIVRHVLLVLTRGGLLFKGHVTDALKTPGIFQTEYLSKIESDHLALLQVRSVLQQLGLDSSCDDSIIVKEVCAVVSQRAAQLCGAGLAAVVDKIRENRRLDHLNITVGVDGSLYKQHPHFAEVLQETTEAMAPQCSVTFLASEEGSGKGAALITAVAKKKTAKPWFT